MVWGIVVVCPFLLFSCGAFAFMSSVGTDDAAEATPGPCGGQGSLAGLGPDYQTIVLAAVGVAKELGIPERGWLVIVAAGIQESRLTNVDHGDSAGPDSRGWLQQRDSWGPIEVRMNPEGAARLFFERLVAVEGWESLPVAQAAQAVQHSAYPSLYAKWEGLAGDVLGEVAGLTCDQGVVMAGGYALPLPKTDIHPPLAEHHNGLPAVDLPAPEGTPIYTITAGTVVYTSPGDACGLGMEIVEADGTRWMYCHSSQRLAADGSTVNVGDQIAAVGSTGHSTGNHLHIQILAAGQPRCPQPFLEALWSAQGDTQILAVDSLPTSGPCVGRV